MLFGQGWVGTENFLNNDYFEHLNKKKYFSWVGVGGWGLIQDNKF